MTDRIGDQGETPSISSREARKMYEAEYKQAADLFERTLDSFTKSDNKYQKEEFKKVMSESLQILNDAAAGLKRKDLLSQNSTIEKDYTAFQADNTKEGKLKSDLEKAKHSV